MVCGLEFNRREFLDWDSGKSSDDSESMMPCSKWVVLNCLLHYESENVATAAMESRLMLRRRYGNSYELGTMA